jgi:hypothetical protein
MVFPEIRDSVIIGAYASATYYQIHVCLRIK